jgi:hypothetical protein
MSPRVNCVIPGCRRGTTRLEDPEDDEAICPPHWRMIPAATKRRRRLISAEIRRLEKIIPSDHDLSEASLRIVVRMLRMRDRNWRLIKAQATRAAAGI